MRKKAVNGNGLAVGNYSLAVSGKSLVVDNANLTVVDNVDLAVSDVGSDAVIVLNWDKGGGV